MLGFVVARVGAGDGGFDHAGGAIDFGFDGVDLDGHFAELGFDEAEIAEAFAERGAFLGIFRGGFQNFLGAADAVGAEAEAAGIERVEGDDVAAAGFVQEIFLRDRGIFEKDRAWWSCP